jgi:hypothetical protein
MQKTSSHNPPTGHRSQQDMSSLTLSVSNQVLHVRARCILYWTAVETRTRHVTKVAVMQIQANSTQKAKLWWDSDSTAHCCQIRPQACLEHN